MATARATSCPKTSTPNRHHDAAIVRALVKDAGGPVHLVGHYLGGTMAVRHALDHPEDIASLTLIEPVLFSLLEETDDPDAVDYLRLAHAMMILVLFGDMETAARKFLGFWVGPDALDAMDADTRDYLIQTVDRVVDDWYGVSTHSPLAPKLADLARIEAPTLVMCAEKTRPSTKAITALLREHIPDTAYADVPGAGHLSPVTHPDRVNPAIVEFIDKQA